MGNSVDGDRPSGKADIDVARMYAKAGEGSLEQKNYKGAVNFFGKALVLQKQLVKRNDLSLVNTCTKLGVAYQGLEDFTQALFYYEKALRKAERKQYHDKISGLYGAIGYMYEKQGKLEKAKKKYDQGLEEARSNLGPQSLVIGNICYQAGMLYIKLEDYKKSMKHLKEALYVLTKYYGEDHTTVGDCYNLMGMATQKQGKLKLAMEFYRKSEVIREEKLDADHLDLAALYCNIGLALNENKKYDEALQYLNKCFGIEIKHFEVAHPRIQSTMRYIENVSNMVEKSCRIEFEGFLVKSNEGKGEKPEEMERLASYTTVPDSLCSLGSGDLLKSPKGLDFEDFINSANNITP